MPSSRRRFHRLAAASLTLVACLAVSTGPAASRSENLPAPVQQNNVVSSLERYAKGEYDQAVKQLIGTRTVRPLVKEFRRDAGAWIERAATPDRTQRTAVVGAMAVELMAATFGQHVDDYAESRSLIEWACARFRKLPTSEVERRFHLAGIALAQGAGDKKFIDGNGHYFNFLDKHAEHPTDRFPSEVRFRLAIATANPETQQIATWPLPPGYMVDPFVERIEHQYERQLLDGSLQMLTELFDDAAVGDEARLRSGVLRFFGRTQRSPGPTSNTPSGRRIR